MVIDGGLTWGGEGVLFYNSHKATVCALGPQSSCGFHLAGTEGVASSEVGTQTGHGLSVKTATCENLGKSLPFSGPQFPH